MEVVAVTEMAVHRWKRGGSRTCSCPSDPPDDDDDGDEDDEEEPSDDDDDDRRRNRRSSRRRRSRDRRNRNNDRPRISRKEAEKVNVPPWPKITKLDGWKMALTMNVTNASADPDIEVWM